MAKRVALACIVLLTISGHAIAQNVDRLIRLFGGIVQQSMVQAAQAEWRKLPPAEISCIDEKLLQQNASVAVVINRGILPTDPRLATFRAVCHNQIGQSSTPAAVQSSAYVVDGLALGGHVRFDSEAYRQYHCAPSDKFTGFTWCHKENTEKTNRGEVTSSNSILHSDDGTALYINRYIEPAFFTESDVANELERLSIRFGEQPREFHLPQRQGLPTAIIAVWGKLELEQLNSGDVSTEASGGTVKGLLVSYLGDVERSAKANVPVYRLGGGPGFLWAAAFDKEGRGVLRFLTSDFSKISPSPSSQPSTAATDTTTNNESVSDVGVKTPGFPDFATLIAIPDACIAARNIGPSQTYVRDPFTGRNAPGPFCNAAAKCLTTIAPRLPALITYLRQHPVLMNQLALPAEIYNGLARAAHSIETASIQNCNFISTLVSYNLISLDGRNNSQPGFERFAIPAQAFLAKLRNDYEADLSFYKNWQPIAKHYDHTSEFDWVKAKYEAAYNASDIDAFFKFKSQFEDERSRAAAYQATLADQDERLAKIDSELADLSRQVHEEKTASIIDKNVIDAVDKLKSDVATVRKISATDRGNSSSDIDEFLHRKTDIESQITAALKKDEARRHGFASTDDYEHCVEEQKRLRSSGIQKSCNR